MITNSKIEPQQYPDFLLIGAARSGTTSIFHYLQQHPNIYIPSKKEPFFFSFMNQDFSHFNSSEFYNSVVWRKSDYVELFKNAKNNQIRGECSTTYLYTYAKTIKNIKTLYGHHYRNLKLVAILRNPIQRAYSHYLYFVRRKLEDLSFRDALRPNTIKQRIPINPAYDYIGYGQYYMSVKAFTETFPLFKVYLFEDLFNREWFIKDLLTFLEVSTEVTIDHNYIANPSGLPKNQLSNFILNSFQRDTYFTRFIKKALANKKKFKFSILKKLLNKPDMPAEIHSSLTDIYKNDISNLQTILGRDLSHWTE